MFKKIAGLFLAATLIVSSAAISVSAAETDAVAAAADDQSVAAGADDQSVAAGASDQSETSGASNVVKFDVKSSGWGNVKTVYCHIWRPDGTGTWTEWQTKKEKCKYDADSGIATYDLANTGNTISPSDGKIYSIIFSVNTGMQTYNAVMSGNCIGDTLYVTGNTYENPEDSAKTAYEAAWRNNPDCGPEKKITSTGKIVGSAFPDGESDATLMATYLIAYYDQDAKMDLVDDLMKELNLDANTVMGAVNDKLAATKNPDADKIRDSVAKTLSKATGETVDKNKTGGGSNGSGSGSSGGSGSGSGSGSSSVKSGQETTILFVFGGLMLAAAGVFFLTRKKREY